MGEISSWELAALYSALLVEFIDESRVVRTISRRRHVFAESFRPRGTRGCGGGGGSFARTYAQ